MAYPIIELPVDAPAQLEQLGTKTKFWYHDHAEQWTLFKEGRPGTGENWAEKVCCEVCRCLGLPHAKYDLASWKDGSGTNHAGVITPTFVPDGGRLVLGNELLARIFADYDQTRRFRAKQHTVRAVMAVTSFPELGLPMGWTPPHGFPDASAVFVGYLMLDTLVGNQDRHHENWGVVFLPGEGVFFAPTFDHASSLGRNETDATRTERLTTKDVGRNMETYASRARSALFATTTSAKPLTTLEAFQVAAKLRPEAADYWVEQLAKIGTATFADILGQIPDTEISEPARSFAVRLMEINATRIRQSIIWNTR